MRPDGREPDELRPITIEREISGPRQLEDVKRERDYLLKLIHS